MMTLKTIHKIPISIDLCFVVCKKYSVQKITTAMNITSITIAIVIFFCTYIITSHINNYIDLHISITIGNMRVDIGELK